MWKQHKCLCHVSEGRPRLPLANADKEHHKLLKMFPTYPGRRYWFIITLIFVNFFTFVFFILTLYFFGEEKGETFALCLKKVLGYLVLKARGL